MTGLAGLGYAQIVADNRRNRQQLAEGPRYHIAILSNVVVNALAPFLEWMFLREGIHVEITHATFDNIVQNSRCVGKPDAAIVFMDMVGIVAAMPNLPTIEDEQLRMLSESLAENIVIILENLRSVPLVIFNSLSALPYERRALRDGPLACLAERLNEALRAEKWPNLLRVNVDKIFASTGLADSLDFRQIHSARAIYTLSFFREWVEYAFPAFRSAVGRSRKVLVVDCDNTLWGGTIGEDGMNGIRLGESTSDGPFFRESQQILKSLKSQGILLAIASKNNPEDVCLVLRSHPEMLLREADFAVLELGWDEKIYSLQRIAKTLNIGIDSLVFMDDSSFELERVKTALPQVTCLQVPARLSDYPCLLRDNVGLFFSLSKSDEDARRTEMYHVDKVRKEAMAQFQSLDDYVASLNVTVEFAEGKAINLARAAQMTQKTNQFNLTTKRYTDADLARMIRDPDIIVATMSVRDRFGDYGTTGLVIVKVSQTEASAFLDTFLLSCRVLGRKVEYAAMDWIRERLIRAQCAKLIGKYLPTPQNGQVADLLDRLGFGCVSEPEGNKQHVLELKESGVSHIGQGERL